MIQATTALVVLRFHILPMELLEISVQRVITAQQEALNQHHVLPLLMKTEKDLTSARIALKDTTVRRLLKNQLSA